MKEIPLDVSTRVMPAILNSEINQFVRWLLQVLWIMPKEVLPVTLLSYVGKEVFEAYRRYRIIYPMLIVLGIFMWPTLCAGVIGLIHWFNVSNVFLCVTPVVLSLAFPVYYGIALDYYLSNERPKWQKYEHHVQIVFCYINVIRTYSGRPQLTTGNFPTDYLEIRRLIDNELMEHSRAVIELDGKHEQEWIRDSMRHLAKSAVVLNYAEDARKGIEPYFSRVEKE